jgi:redox-sensitive bicupin YhaK (pirin superfamily)
LHYVHLQLQAGAEAELGSGHAERAVYVAVGAIEISDTPVAAGQMLVLNHKASRIRATVASTVMLLGGDAIGPRHIYWNFVSSDKGRLEQAAQDWRAGRMKLPDGDDEAFIALPEGPGPSAPGFI